MEANETISKEVIIFFKKNLMLKQIDKNTIINTENFTSEDAFFILEDFIKKFDINKGFLDIDSYFQPTYINGSLWKAFLHNIGFIKPEYKKLPPITISHMIEVAKRKEWFDPE